MIIIIPLALGFFWGLVTLALSHNASVSLVVGVLAFLFSGFALCVVRSGKVE